MKSSWYLFATFLSFARWCACDILPCGPVIQYNGQTARQSGRFHMHHGHACAVHKGQASEVHQGHACEVHQGHACDVHQGQACEVHQDQACEVLSSCVVCLDGMRMSGRL